MEAKRVIADSSAREQATDEADESSPPPDSSKVQPKKEEREFDIVDEASDESFPASDPPARW